MNDLIEQLRQKQGDTSAAEFAEHLGISERALFFWYSEDRNPGAQALGRIALLFPDLKDVILKYLYQRGAK